MVIPLLIALHPVTVSNTSTVTTSPSPISSVGGADIGGKPEGIESTIPQEDIGLSPQPEEKKSLTLGESLKQHIK